MPIRNDPWPRWEEARRRAATLVEAARALDDALLMDLLATTEGAPESRRILAVEAMRRLTDRAQRALEDRDAPPDAERLRRIANRAAEHVHNAEIAAERREGTGTPRVEAAHETSYLAEQQRAHVETLLERRARLHKAAEELRDAQREGA
ncbi:MAG: hypothetical protein QOE90_3148 [Thermoplasmata archaeon]|jgi:hypothetical protein|nr:hypothetical protein [Thermoplasmata archaeon]